MDNILIVGPGAVGLVLAARWAQAGVPVRLLSRAPAADSRLARRGFLYTAPDGTKGRIRRNLLPAGRRGQAGCAAAFFCVKSQDLPAALRRAKPWIGPDAAVVFLQGGVGHEQLLRRSFPPERTVLASCFFAADRTAPDAAVHRGGRTLRVAVDGRNAAAAALVRRLLRRGGWEVSVERCADRMLWTKLCVDAAVDGLAALVRAPNGMVAADPALRELLGSVAWEAECAARRAGHRVDERLVDLALRGCRMAPDHRNPLLQDLEAGRPTEAGALFDPLLAAARRNGAPMPRLSIIAAALRRLEG